MTYRMILIMGKFIHQMKSHRVWKNLLSNRSCSAYSTKRIGKANCLPQKAHNNIRHKSITKKMLIVILTLFIKIQIMILVSG